MDDEKLKDIALNFQANISNELLKENMELKKEIKALQTQLKKSPESFNKESATESMLNADLISKEAVLHIFDDMTKEYAKTQDFDRVSGIAWVSVQRLPSVQPEIIRCHQCKYAEVADLEDSQDGYTCQFHRGSIWFSGSYCSWAERRQDG